MLGSHKSYHIINHMHVYLVPTGYRTSIDRINLHQTLALSNFLSWLLAMNNMCLILWELEWLAYWSHISQTKFCSRVDNSESPSYSFFLNLTDGSFPWWALLGLTLLFFRWHEDISRKTSPILGPSPPSRLKSAVVCCSWSACWSWFDFIYFQDKWTVTLTSSPKKACKTTGTQNGMWMPVLRV